MAKRFSILNKSNGSEAHPFTLTTDGEGRANEKGTTKHTWKIFKILSKTWKAGKGKDVNNNPTAKNTEVENESNSSSEQVRNEIEMNPFTDSTGEHDLNATNTKNSTDDDEPGKFGHNLLNKMNLQKLLGLFASANRKRQELLKHKANKKEFHLDKARTFIVGQGPFKQEERETDSASFLSEEERDVYDITYEDSARATSRLSKSTMSVTNIPMKTKLFIDCEKFGSTSTPANSLEDETQTASNALETDSDDEDEDETQNNTLDLLQSVCDKLVSHDFNIPGNSSSLNINANAKIKFSYSDFVLNTDMESDSDEEDSECELSETSVQINNENAEEEDLKEPPEDFLEPPENEDGGRMMEDEKKGGAIGDAEGLGKVQVKLNTIQNLYTKTPEALPVIEETSQCDVEGSSDEASTKEERTENQKTYIVVEDDIKCMIKELLDETKTIKETVVSGGFSEEIEPPFTYAISQNFASYGMCRSICEELINAVTTTYNKAFNIPNRKNIFTSKEVTKTAVSDVRYIMNILLEQIVGVLPDEKFDLEPNKDFMTVNYCLVNDCPLLNSKIYLVGNKFWQTNKNCNPRLVCTPRLPLVTIRNLSSTPRISVFKTDEKLVNRMRKSAALLLALYEEMRDYSYQNTSRLFNDLYETINLLDLSRHVVEHPKPNCLIERKKSTPKVNSKPPANPVTEKKEMHEDKPEVAGSSCSKSTSKADVKPTYSDSSLCSSEIAEDAEACGILPNLKYTYISDEEINTAEEIQKIETNATENSMRNADLRTTDKEFAMELDATNDDATNSNDDDVILDEETPKQ